MKVTALTLRTRSFDRLRLSQDDNWRPSPSAWSCTSRKWRRLARSTAHLEPPAEAGHRRTTVTLDTLLASDQSSAHAVATMEWRLEANQRNRTLAQFRDDLPQFEHLSQQGVGDGAWLGAP